MSNRQKNITLTADQVNYIRSNPDETIKSIASRFEISEGKVSINLKLMGLSRSPNQKELNWETNGMFNEQEFGKLYRF